MHLDNLILKFDKILKSQSLLQSRGSRRNPANTEPNHPLQPHEKLSSIAMMRVNHSGEVCAQALYQGQALFAQTPKQYEALQQSALEEVDHLNWCEERLRELNARPSIFNPFWYAGSFVLGASAALFGDKYSMGFLAETERQVTQHIETHLERISPNDHKSKAILKQMCIDEMEHATKAVNLGSKELPDFIKTLMQKTANILKFVASRI